MYGTRAAADGWQQECSGFLRSIGFQQGEAPPCVFMHNLKNMATSVHGDDFTSVGPKVELDRLETQLEGWYGLRKGRRLGPGENDAKEILLLNRAMRWTELGFEYEADERLRRTRHGDCKSAPTPGLTGSNCSLQPRRANGDVRGRHEAPGAVLTGAQTPRLNTPIPESRGH